MHKKGGWHIEIKKFAHKVAKKFHAHGTLAKRRVVSGKYRVKVIYLGHHSITRDQAHRKFRIRR